MNPPKFTILREICDAHLIGDIWVSIMRQFSRLFDIYHIANKVSYYDYSDKVESNIIKAMIQFANRNTILKGAIYEGKMYYERTNTWSNSDHPDDASHDKDVVCDGYSKCEDKHDDIIECEPSEVEYVFEQMINDIHDDADCLEFFNRDDNNLDEIIVVGHRYISFENMSGINDDHRGSTHCKLTLDYEDTIEFERYITLKDVCDTFYRLKSHKFDNWYEMYCRTKKMREEQNYYFELTFDHGS